MKFYVEQEIFQKIPDYCVGVVRACRVKNSEYGEEIRNFLFETLNEKKQQLEGQNVKLLPELAPFREAFLKLEINPNKYMSSIESLLTRVAKKGELPSINPLVDLGNAVSLRYSLPLGIHDIQSFKGTGLAVRLATQADCDATPVEEGSSDVIKPGEAVYVSGVEVRTRRFIWRQLAAGRIDENSTDLVFPIDGFAVRKQDVISARDELFELIQKYFGVSAQKGFIDIDNPEFDLS